MTDAQAEIHVKVDGVEYARIPYGVDHPDIEVKPQCRDCGVAVGHLHVPGCCVERCPRCRVGQAYGGCECAHRQVTQ